MPVRHLPTRHSLNHPGLHPADFEKDSYYGELLEEFFSEMDKNGVVVVISAGNYGYNKDTGKPDYYQADRSPQNFVTNESPYINVGATYHDGSIVEFTTPPGEWLGGGQLDDPSTPSISIWAQGVGVLTCNPKPLAPMGFRSGTSYAAPQVVSAPLSQPESLELFPMTRIHKSRSAIRLLMALPYSGWSCCLYALISLA